MSAPMRVTLMAALRAHALPWTHGTTRNRASTLAWMYPRGRGRGAGRGSTIDPYAASAWLLANRHGGCAKNMATLVAEIAAAEAAGDLDAARRIAAGDRDRDDANNK